MPDYYVATTGNDTNAGTRANPFLTLEKALSMTAAGGNIFVDKGRYAGQVDDTLVRSERAVVWAEGAVFDKYANVGGTGVTFHGGKFIGGISLSSNVALTLCAEDITFDGCEMEGAESAGDGALIQNAAKRIEIINCYMHDLSYGVRGPGKVNDTYTSFDILVKNCLIEHVRIDCVQIGDWHDVVVDGCTLRYADDPLDEYHNDGIQLTGGNKETKILNNTIYGMSQPLFIQDAIRPIDGLHVENNKLGRCWAVSCQSQGATKAKYFNNTMEGNVHGALWLVKGYNRGAGTPVIPTDTEVVGNRLSSFVKRDGCATSIEADNIVGVTPLPHSAPIPSPPPYIDTVIGDGPVAYWRFGESAGGLAADELGSLNGTYIGSPVLGVDGVIPDNTAVQLSTGKYVSVSDQGNALDFGSSPFSLEIWVKPSSLAGIRTLFSRGTGSYQLRIGSGQQLQLVREAQAVLGGSTGLISTTDEWHHIVMTRAASGETIFYIDGQPAGTFTGGVLNAVSSSTLFIGARGTSGESVNGVVDEAAAYNRVLSPAEVLTHYEDAGVA